jgi:hypothetical protein
MVYYESWDFENYLPVLSPVNSIISGQTFVHVEWLRNGMWKERITREIELVERRWRDPRWKTEENPFERNGILQRTSQLKETFLQLQKNSILLGP